MFELNIIVPSNLFKIGKEKYSLDLNPESMADEDAIRNSAH